MHPRPPQLTLRETTGGADTPHRGADQTGQVEATIEPARDGAKVAIGELVVLAGLPICRRGPEDGVSANPSAATDRKPLQQTTRPGLFGASHDIAYPAHEGRASGKSLNRLPVQV
jgi:hypothetical protein